MDFDLDFGRFFGLEIDTFTEAGIQKMCPPRKPELQKNVIFLKENAIFYKIDDFCFDVEIDEKHGKNEKTAVENQCLF